MGWQCLCDLLDHLFCGGFLAAAFGQDHEQKDRACHLASLWRDWIALSLFHPRQEYSAVNDGRRGHCLGFNSRAAFGPNNPNSAIYVVMAGGVFLTLAAISVLLVRDDADRELPKDAVLDADRHELFTLQESAQPVPSTGLV